MTSAIRSRAPHVWLKDRRSTLDLFGKGFTLLNLSNKKTDANAFTTASRKVGMPLEVAALDDPNVRDIYEARFVLVRPDGHVAWRGNAMPENATAIRDTVRGAEESRK